MIAIAVANRETRGLTQWGGLAWLLCDPGIGPMGRDIKVNSSA